MSRLVEKGPEQVDGELRQPIIWGILQYNLSYQCRVESLRVTFPSSICYRLY